MPRNFWFWVSLIVWPKIVSLVVHLNSALLEVKRQFSHSPMLRFSPICLLHSTTMSTSPCIFKSRSAFLLPLTANARSSAYVALTVVSSSNLYSKSSRNVINRSGGSTAPLRCFAILFLSFLVPLSVLLPLMLPYSCMKVIALARGWSAICPCRA